MTGKTFAGGPLGSLGICSNNIAVLMGEKPAAEAAETSQGATYSKPSLINIHELWPEELRKI